MHANDLIDMRIIENGRFIPNIMAGSIEQAVREIIDLINSTLIDRDLTIKIRLPRMLPELANFDKRRLQ